MAGKFLSMTQAFRDMDKDGDGKINALELQSVLNYNALEDIDANLVIAEIEGNDGDGNGEIDVREFLDWTNLKPKKEEKKGAAVGGVINARNL